MEDFLFFKNNVGTQSFVCIDGLQNWCIRLKLFIFCLERLKGTSTSKHNVRYMHYMLRWFPSCLRKRDRRGGKNAKRKIKWRWMNSCSFTLGDVASQTTGGNFTGTNVYQRPRLKHKPARSRKRQQTSELPVQDVQDFWAGTGGGRGQDKEVHWSSYLREVCSIARPSDISSPTSIFPQLESLTFRLHLKL